MSDEIPLPALPPRPPDSHKASVGRVLVIGGSLGMAGAPVLAARGALRAGAGLVTVAVPERIRDVVSGFLPEVMTIGLPCDVDGGLESSARAAIEGYLERADAVVLGPGLGRAPCTEDAVLALLAAIDRPVVLDADGLYAVRMKVSDLASRKAVTVLTPHKGEASALLAESGSTQISHRPDRAKRIAVASGGICVLKGPGTLVTDGTRTYKNGTGGPVLSTGGSGDVLSGMIAAFLAGLPATGGDAFGAACLAVHVHGAAGDLLAARRGDRGSLASEIADAVPEAIRAVVQRGRTT